MLCGVSFTMKEFMFSLGLRNFLARKFFVKCVYFPSIKSLFHLNFISLTCF